MTSNPKAFEPSGKDFIFFPPFYKFARGKMTCVILLKVTIPWHWLYRESGNYTSNVDLSAGQLNRIEVKMLGQLCLEKKWLNQTWPTRWSAITGLKSKQSGVPKCACVHTCKHLYMRIWKMYVLLLIYFISQRTPGGKKSQALHLYAIDIFLPNGSELQHTIFCSYKNYSTVRRLLTQQHEQHEALNS